MSSGLHGSVYVPVLVGRTGYTSERHNSRPSRSLKLDTFCRSDRRRADRHHGCVCVPAEQMWLPGVGQGGWKDSRKVPHAALTHNGSAGRSRGKDPPGKDRQIQGHGFEGQATGQEEPFLSIMVIPLHLTGNSSRQLSTALGVGWGSDEVRQCRGHAGRLRSAPSIVRGSDLLTSRA